MLDILSLLMVREKRKKGFHRKEKGCFIGSLCLCSFSYSKEHCNDCND